MTKIDAITLEIMRNGFQSIADEMTAALVRTAYSTNIKDRRDCSCALLTKDGEVVAQTELGTPFHLGVMPAAVEVILCKYPLAKLHPGDVIISNVPYPMGPGHLSDVTLMSPVFYQDEIVALVANQAHHVDMGGFAPGSMAFGVTEIYQEGLQIPPIKLMKRSRMDEEILALIMQNIRTGKETKGDMMAQIAPATVTGTVKNSPMPARSFILPPCLVTWNSHQRASGTGRERNRTWPPRARTRLPCRCSIEIFSSPPWPLRSS